MKKINFHLIFMALILIFIAVIGWRIYVWNKGEDSGYDPNDTSTEFDREALDYVQPLTKDQLAEHPDDGVNTILCLGNAPFSDDKTEAGLANQISLAVSAGAGETVVYDCSFAESYLSQKNPAYTDNYATDGFSLYPVTRAFCTGDYSVLESAIAKKPRDDNDYSIKLLKSLDFSTIDTIVIMYDISDYIDRRPVMDPNDSNNLVTVTGSLNASIQLIQQTYPYIRIVVMSHTYGGFTADNYYVDGDTIDLGNGTLPTYMLLCIDVAQANGVTYLDNYYGVISPDEKDVYLVDEYHINEDGRKAIAERFAKMIYKTEE